MRVLFLLTQDLESPSGLGRYYPLAKALTRFGYDVTIATLHSDYLNLKTRSFVSEGVKIKYVAPMHVRKRGNIKSYYPAYQMVLMSALSTWQLGRSAMTIPADIVHIGKPHPMNSLAGLAAKYLLGRQIYLDCDDYEAEIGHFNAGWQKEVVKFFENKVPLRVDYVTTNTYYTRDRLLASGVEPKRVFYLSNGVDRDRFAWPDPESVHQLRSSLGLQDKKVIVYIGSLSRPSHPVELLLEAFVSIHKEQPDSSLLLVGGGDEYTRLKEQVQRMGLSEWVHFKGRIPADQVVLYYHLAEVSVDPIHDDDAARGRSPLKLFESWACGVPFVSSDVGDRRILLGDPPAGMLAIPGDPDSLANAVLQVITDPQTGGELRKIGLNRVGEFYWDQLASKLDVVYQEHAIR